MTHKQDMKRVMVLSILLMAVGGCAVPEQDIQIIQQAMPTQPVVEPTADCSMVPEQHIQKIQQAMPTQPVPNQPCLELYWYSVCVVDSSMIQSPIGSKLWM